MQRSPDLESQGEKAGSAVFQGESCSPVLLDYTVQPEAQCVMLRRVKSSRTRC